MCVCVVCVCACVCVSVIIVCVCCARVRACVWKEKEGFFHVNKYLHTFRILHTNPKTAHKL